MVDTGDGHSGKIMVAATVFGGFFAGIGVSSAVKGGGSPVRMVSVLLILTFFAFVYRLLCLRRKVRGAGVSRPHWTEPALEPERAVVFIIVLLIVLYVTVNVVTGDEDPSVPESLTVVVAGVIILTPLVQIFVTKASDWRELLAKIGA